MGKCSVGIAFFTTHCNYTLIVYFENRVLLPRSRPVSGGSSAQRWRDVRPGLTEQGLGSLSLLSEKGDTTKKKKKKSWGGTLPLTPHGGSPRPLPLPAEPALSPGLATALATSGLLPLVSPGKRSAAARPDQGRASTSGSGGAEDAWSCARTRGLCRSESHSDPSCRSQRFCGDRGLAAARQLREWTLLGRAPVEVLLGVACEWGLGPCAAASIFKVLWALWGKGVQIFPQKKFFFFSFLPLTTIFSAVWPKKSLFRQS